MRSLDLLVLRYEQFSDRVNGMFEELRRSPAQRELFIKDPALVIAETVLRSANPPRATLDYSNRLLYALLSNQKFLTWAAKYQMRLFHEIREAREESSAVEAQRIALQLLDRRKLYRDLAEGIKEFGDIEYFYAISLKSVTRGEEIPLFLTEGEEPPEFSPVLVFPVVILLLAFLEFVAVIDSKLFYTQDVVTDHPTPPPVCPTPPPVCPTPPPPVCPTPPPVCPTPPPPVCPAAIEDDLLRAQSPGGSHPDYLFGLTRTDLHKFAFALGREMEAHARWLRAQGKMTSPTPLEDDTF